MEYGTIERDIDIDASPEIVFEVISQPRHIQEWWPDEAHLEPVPGANGDLVWRNGDTGETMTVELAVVDVDPPKRFSFRWCYTEPARQGTSLLVTFELEPIPSGTRVRMTESGFRELGWEIAKLEDAYNEHSTGWDFFIPRLGEYVSRLVSS